MADAYALRSGTFGYYNGSTFLHIIAPTGSTITLMKNNVAIKVLGPSKSHIKLGDNSLAHWYYYISTSDYGIWIVDAELNGAVDNKTIVIDSPGEYVVTINYRLYLYNRGDKCLDVVGAWNAVAWRYNSTSANGKAPTVTWNSIYFEWTLANGGGGLRTRDTVDVTKYNRFGVVWSTGNESGNSISAIVHPTIPTYGQDIDGYPRIYVSGSGHVAGSEETDISELTGGHYISIRGSWASGTMTTSIYQIYLDQ